MKFTIICYNFQLVFLALMLNLEVTKAFHPDEFCIRRDSDFSNCTQREFYYPWPTNEACKTYKVTLFPKGTYKPTALASFVCSGGNWLVQAVERATGIVTGSLDVPSLKSSPQSEIRCGLNYMDGRTILQNNRDVISKLFPTTYRKAVSYDGEDESWPTLSKVYYNYRGVLLIRNPWHALLNSREMVRNTLRKCSQCKRTPKNLLKTVDFKHDEFEKNLKKGAKMWVDHAKRWIKGSPHGSEMVIIQYEKLIENPEPEIRRILAYLNVTVDESRLKCLLADSPFFKERFSANEIKYRISNFFKKNMDFKSRQILEQGILEINGILHSKGIEFYLNYSRPNFTELLTRSSAYLTRKEI